MKENLNVNCSFAKSFKKLRNFIIGYNNCQIINEHEYENTLKILSESFTNQKYIVIDCVDNIAFVTNNLNIKCNINNTYAIDVQSGNLTLLKTVTLYPLPPVD